MKKKSSPAVAWLGYRPQNNLTVIWRVMSDYMRPYWHKYALAVACMMVVAGSTALTAQLMRPILDDVFLKQDETMMYIVPAVIVVVFVAKGWAEFGHMMLSVRASASIMTDLQKQLFATILKREIVFFDTNSSGRLASRVTVEVSIIVGAIVNLLVGYVRDGLSFIGLLSVMIYQDWKLSLLVLAIFIFSYIPVIKIAKRMRKSGSKHQFMIGVLNEQLIEIFSGIRMVQSYGREKKEKERIRRTVDKIRNLTRKMARLQASPRPIMESLTGIAVGVVVYYGGQQVLAGEATPGALFAFITAMLLAYKPAKQLVNLHIQLQMGVAAARNVFAVLDRPPVIRDKPNAITLPDSADNGWDIEFKNVNFSYNRRAKALNGMNLHIPANHTAALVGASGGGKSTTFNLLGRFYEPQKGAVCIGGYDIKKVTLESLRAKIAYVSQDIVLFNDSAYQNILFGRENASRDEVMAAARQAAADEFISQLPKGYDTVIGERGVLLSGGQRQRIALARALLKKSPIILLDEATAALDNESEFHIRKALNHIKGERTIVIIAHRLSTVRDADCIFVVQEGEIIEKGSYEQLLSQKGAFAHLHEFQNKLENLKMKSPMPKHKPSFASS